MALAVLALTRISTLVLDIVMPGNYWVFIFCTSCVAYNFIRYFETVKQGRLQQIPFFKILVGTNMTLSCIGMGSFFFLSAKGMLLMLGTGFITILYCMPLGRNFENLRNQNGVKAYMVALSWTLVSVGLPWTLSNTPDVIWFLWLAAIHFVYVLVAIQPFDIRDMKSDQPTLGTWPQSYGVRGTVIRATLLAVTLMFGVFFFSPLSKIFISVTGVIFLLLIVFLWKSSPSRSPIFSSFWVESIPVFWWGLLECLLR